MTHHVTPLSCAPTSHGCWAAVGLLSHLAVIFRHSCLCFQAVVSVSRCVGAADFEFRQVPSESRVSVGTSTRHITPLSRAPTSHGRWSAVGLLSHLAVIFGYSRLCFWAAVSASRCVGAADFEFWQVSSKHGRIDLPRHASLTCPNITWPLVCSGTTVLSGCHIWALSSMLLGWGISEPLCGGKLTLNFGRF